MNDKDELKYILTNIYELQRFAEAKHAGLIVLNSAVIIGLLSSYSEISIFEKKIILFTTFLLGISIFGSLIAQFPQTISNTISGKLNNIPNLYYYNDLSKISIEEFILEFKKSYSNFIVDKMNKDMISQIIVNSKITFYKFLIFKYCVYLSTLGIGILGFFIMIKIFF